MCAGSGENEKFWFDELNMKEAEKGVELSHNFYNESFFISTPLLFS